MENKEKLLSRIPALVAENNKDELIEIRKIVGEGNAELTNAIARVANVEINAHEMKYKYFREILALFREGKVAEASALCDEYLQKAPFSHDPWLLRMYIDANGNMTYRDDGESLVATGMRIVLDEARKRYDKGKDYEKLYLIYLSAKDYLSARSLSYEYGQKALKEKNYAQAEMYFRRAVSYKDAEEMAYRAHNAPAEYERFKKEIPPTYIDEIVKRNHSSLISSLAAERRKSNSSPCGYGVFCVICFIAAFVLSLFTHWDRELKIHVVYIGFAIVATIGIHKLFDLDFELLPTGIIGFVCVAAPKLLQLGSLKLFDTPAVGFVILNVVFGAAALFTLVKQISSIPGNRACRSAEELMTKLRKEVWSYKDELIKQYSPKVGKDIARSWVDELKDTYF